MRRPDKVSQGHPSAYLSTRQHGVVLHVIWITIQTDFRWHTFSPWIDYGNLYTTKRIHPVIHTHPYRPHSLLSLEYSHCLSLNWLWTKEKRKQYRDIYIPVHTFWKSPNSFARHVHTLLVLLVTDSRSHKRMLQRLGLWCVQAPLGVNFYCGTENYNAICDAFNCIGFNFQTAVLSSLWYWNKSISIERQYCICIVCFYANNPYRRQ